MRRLVLIAIVVAGLAGGWAASAGGDDTHVYFLELDNAFGLADGSQVKVAGVPAGTVSELLVNSRKRAVAKLELSGPVAVLGERTVCSAEPQSLIAEYFIDCTPKGPPIDPGEGNDAERAEAPDIPVSQTRQTVQNDLVLSTVRLPFRERLRLLINEFGTALAANGENLNAAIRRGAPALRQTRQVTRLLAGQSRTIRDLNANADRIIARLAERRRDVVDFIEKARDTSRTANTRRDELSQSFALLDDFLAELRPAMAQLGALAEQGTPLAGDLRGAAPGLSTLSRRLPGFGASARRGLVALGRAAVPGRRALRRGRDEIRVLRRAAQGSFPPADALAKFTSDIDDPRRAVEEDRRANRDSGRKGQTGYTGLEGLLNYLYYQAGAINQYDEIGHLLHFSIFEVATGPCSAYNAASDVPAAGGGRTTDIRRAHRCVAWLGPNQPGINQDVSIPPYDPSVCPDGSTDTSICDPAGSPRTREGLAGGEDAAGAGAADGSPRDSTGRGGAGDEGAGGRDDGTQGGSGDGGGPGGSDDESGSPGGGLGLPDLPGLSDLLGGGRRAERSGARATRAGAAARSKRAERRARQRARSGGAAIGGDLFDYLFGR